MRDTASQLPNDAFGLGSAALTDTQHGWQRHGRQSFTRRVGLVAFGEVVSNPYIGTAPTLKQVQIPWRSGCVFHSGSLAGRRGRHFLFGH